MTLLVVGCLVAQAAPEADPATDLVVALRSELALPGTWGSGDGTWASLAASVGRWDGATDPRVDTLRALLAPELAGQAGGPWDFAVGVRPWVRLAGGDGKTVGLSGDDDVGLVAARLGVDASARSGWFEVGLAASGGGGLAPVDGALLVDRAFVGLRRGPVRVGFGAEDRTLGPGRRGSLILWEDARTFPAGVLQAEGPLWRLGEVRADFGVGWLQAARLDVANPGALWMDLRWAPAPFVEVGASRFSMFAGEGRPWPGVGQLLLPTDPHVEDDPNQLLADQDELAALDVRVTLPLSRWSGGPVHGLSAWYQYGGEDMIVRRVAGLPVPSLAGVGNLYGAELVVGPVAVVAERAVLMDDLFRWYTGHRVYHQGQTQDGRNLGHPEGGDMANTWVEARWRGLPWSLALFGEHTWRVGAVEMSDRGTVFTLAADEHTWRAGAEGWWVQGPWGTVAAGLALDRVTGEDFVPGASAWHPRAWVEWHLGLRSLGSPRQRPEGRPAGAVPRSGTERAAASEPPEGRGAALAAGAQGAR